MALEADGLQNMVGTLDSSYRGNPRHAGDYLGLLAYIHAVMFHTRFFESPGLTNAEVFPARFMYYVQAENVRMFTRLFV